jgi:hypothetical protein
VFAWNTAKGRVATFALSQFRSMEPTGARFTLHRHDVGHSIGMQHEKTDWNSVRRSTMRVLHYA